MMDLISFSTRFQQRNTFRAISNMFNQIFKTAFLMCFYGYKKSLAVSHLARYVEELNEWENSCKLPRKRWFYVVFDEETILAMKNINENSDTILISAIQYNDAFIGEHRYEM